MTFEDETNVEQVVDPSDEASVPQAESEADDDDVVDAHIWRAQS